MRSKRLGAVAVVATAAVAAGTGLAQGVTGSADPPAPRLTLDRSDPVLPEQLASDLVPGSTRSGCLTVGNASGGPLRVGIYAARLAGDLAPHLRLAIRRGRPTVASGSCAGFVAEDTVYDGRLADLPGESATAVADPLRLTSGEASAYRFELTLEDAPSARGRRVDWDFGFAAQAVAGPEDEPTAAPTAEPTAAPIPAVPTAQAPQTPRGADPADGARTVDARPAPVPGTRIGAPCRSLALPVGRTSLRKRLRLGSSQPTSATFRLQGTRLVVTAGGRAQHARRGGGRWSSVTYAIDRRVRLRSRRPPFRARIAPQQVATGPNRIVVTVASRRDALRTGTLTLSAQAGAAGRCVLR